MRSNDFPLAIEVDDVTYAPAMLASFDDRTQVWAAVDGKPQVVVEGPALQTRDASTRGLRTQSGRKVLWSAVLVDGTTWAIARHAHCCGCHRHVLCGWVPPEPAAINEEATA